VLRDISSALPLDQEIKNAFTECILAIYGTLRTDFRYYYSVGKYVRIISSVPELDYRGASIANEILTSSCMRCKKMGFYSEMTNSENSSSGLVCEKCGCTDPVKVRINTKHLKNIAMNSSNLRILVASQFVHLFHDILESYNFGLKKPELKREFMQRFGIYEELARKDLLGSRSAYFIGHYDPKKPNRKRWCSLNEHEIAHIKINDPIYFNEYKRWIAKYVEVTNDNNSIFSPIKIRVKLQDILSTLSWPEQFVKEKINQDSLEIHLLDNNIPTPQHVNTLKENRMNTNILKV
jgi:hypothetical protein